jgi:acyl-[acyl-carrier-protein]-phospholipid O-acyltransferase/long-chain-fatty-acid--[acyl-carrier-protein] ligase
MKALLRLVLRLLFRFRAYGTESLSAPGPVLLVPNHVSWLDWLFLWVLLEGDWKFVVSSVVAETSPLHRLLMRNERTFPIDPSSPYATRHMAEHLRRGGRLVLFAEGRITFTGSLMKLFEGTGFLLAKTPARVVTCYLRGAERLRLSRNPGKRFWFPTVSAHFSGVLDPVRPEHLPVARQRTMLTDWLRQRMVAQQFEVEMRHGATTLPEAILETAVARPSFVSLEDAAQKPMTYRKWVVSAGVLSRVLRREGGVDGAPVGVLLPNVCATPVVLMALWMRGATPSVLNFSSGMAVVAECCRVAGVLRVITSRAFVEKARLDLAPLVAAGVTLVFLETVREGITLADKLASAARFSLMPGGLLGSLASPSDPAVILFTSGSEGVPKAVPLSHRNVLANIRQMLAVTDLNDTDRVFNALPLFHSFGLSVGMLLGLVRGSYVFLYPSPLHYRMIPNAIYEKNCTVFLSTNTFLNGYARRANPYDFRTLRYLFAAAEKVQQSTVATWASQFGVRVLEGYGATECGPAVSVNVPVASRGGSTGRLLPGMEYRLEPVDGVAEGGRLWVRGPNVMGGYLNGSESARKSLVDGWYDTGDIARVDEDGFVYVLGRLKRFAKVSGEMVSLTAVEDALAGAFPQHGPRCMVAVVAEPDEDKGELLVAVSNCAGLTREEVRAAVRAKGLTNLCVPSRIAVVSQIPLLGTGKIHHRELERMLREERAAQPA